MLKLIKRVLGAAVIIAAVTAPTAAYARPELDPPAPPAPVGALPLHAAPAPHHAVATASRSFAWGDAGVGAGGLLVLVGSAPGPPSCTAAGRTTRWPVDPTTSRGERTGGETAPAARALLRPASKGLPPSDSSGSPRRRGDH